MDSKPEKPLQWGDSTLQSKARYLESCLHWQGLTDDQKQVLKQFDCDNVLNNVKITSRCVNISYMKDFALFVKKSFTDVVRKDIEQYLLNLIEVKKLSPITVRNRKITIKRFFQWLYETERGQYPNVVSWINVGSEYNYKMPENMPTIDDIRTILDKGCRTSQQKAIISILWETGIRAGELIGCNIGDVEFENVGASIYIRNSKTKPRKLFVFDSVPVLRDWMNRHPFKDNMSAPLFFCTSNRDFSKRLTQGGLRELLIDLSVVAGIKKKMTTHLIRHGSLTFQSKYLSDSELKMQAGWTMDSRMLKIYNHLSTEDLKQKQMLQRGLISSGEINKALQYIQCPRCKEINDCTSVYCCKCSFPLQKEEALKIATATKVRESILTLIFDDQQIQDRIIRLTQEDGRIKKLSETLVKVVPQ